MKITKNINVEGKHGRYILADIFFTQNQSPKPVVIFAHGYKGFKDWGCWNLVAKEFGASNVFFLKFNFSHNGGTVEQPIDFPDLEAFGNNNFSKELDDLDRIINWLLANDALKKEVDPDNITLIGHSRGGGIVTIKASEDKRISKLITWASVSDFEARFPKGEALRLWQKKGVSFIENSRTKQKMPHYYQFFENFMQHKERLNIQRAARNLKIPHLIIHGTSDETVRLSEAKMLHSWSPKSKLLTIENANHTFGGLHPWKENELPADLKQTTVNSIVFVKKLTSKY